jgi:predicted nucleotide-binding protein (sugar kinase/HSP70/actin superfamily)
MIEGSIVAQPLRERVVYIPRMNYGSARMFAAAFHSLHIEAEVLPESTPETLSMAGVFTSGDECLPQRITLGSILKVMNRPGFDPSKSAFFMPTAHGPCRFGQYSIFFRKVFKKIGYDDVMILALSTCDGYNALGGNEIEFSRTAWRALVAGDILRKLLLKNRPYECNRGETDAVYSAALERMSDAVALSGVSHRVRMNGLIRSLEKVRDDFRNIPVHDPGSKPLIGAIGEIYCRLDDAANDGIIRHIEEYGGEVWLAGICEWLEYTNEEVLYNLHVGGRSLSPARIAFELRRFIQRKDEHALVKLFSEDFHGYEEPAEMKEIFKRSQPYLPSTAALGEMVINIGRAVFLYEKGVDGIIDISPFTCMNAIVSEAIYPKISRDHDAIPIRVLYFDGKARDWNQDVEMFMELVGEYRKRKQGKNV